MALAFAQIFVGFTALCIVLTLVAAPIMKFFVRELPIYKLALVFFWAAFRVLFITAVVMVVVMLANIAVPSSLSGLLTIIGMCAVGSLITYSLEHYGIPKHKFPGVGAKTIFVLFVLSWVAVGLWFLATKL